MGASAISEHPKVFDGKKSRFDFFERMGAGAGEMNPEFVRSADEKRNHAY